MPDEELVELEKVFSYAGKQKYIIARRIRRMPLEEKKRYLTKILDSDVLGKPAVVFAYGQLGECYEKLRDFDAALTCFQSAGNKRKQRALENKLRQGK